MASRAPSTHPESSLKELWEIAEIQQKQELQFKEESSSSLLSHAATVNAFIEQQGGFALTGLAIVPSRYTGPQAHLAEKVIRVITKSPNFKIKKFDLPIQQDMERRVNGIIYFPKGWDAKDRSRCVLYHSPTGISVAEYFADGELTCTAGKILQWAKCPIIMYDYRGTGLSSKSIRLSSSEFQPTYETVLADGEAVLQYALEQFTSVQILGSSLGGGVGTVSLDRHLDKHPKDQQRVSLYNHDSFSTTTRVAMAGWPRAEIWVNWLIRLVPARLIDAQSSMERLINRAIPVTILSHRRDPVLPPGSRMAEFAETRKQQNVSILYSEAYGHANLSDDLCDQLPKM